MRKALQQIILLLAVPVCLFSQSSSLDSLNRALLEASFIDSTKIYILLAEEYYIIRDYPNCVSHGSKALELARTGHNDMHLAHSKKWLSYGYRHLRDSALSMKYANEAIRIYEDNDRYEDAADVYNSILKLYLDYGATQKALHFGLIALRIRETHNLPDGVLYGNLAVLYDLIGISEKNLEYSLKNLEISKLTGDRIGEAIAYNSIAKAYMDTKDYNAAEEAYENAREIFQELGISRHVAVMYNNLAGVYDRKGDFQRALEYYRKSIEIKKQNGMDLGIIFSLKGRGEVYFQLKEWEKALEHFNRGIAIADSISNQMMVSDLKNKAALVYYQRQQYHIAYQLFSESNTIAVENKLMSIAKVNYKFLAKIDSLNRQFEKAFNNFYAYNEIKDTLLSEESNKQLTEMMIRFETEKKNDEIDFLAHKIVLQKRIYFVLFLFLILLLLTVYLAYARHRLKMKLRNKVEALKQEELKATAELNRLNAEKLQEELDHRNRELTASAVYIAERNEILNSLKEQIDALTLQTDHNADLKQISKNIDQSIELDGGWTKLKYHFERVHPQFLEKLQADYTGLTQNDLKLCAYIKLRLSQKEIAKILNVSLKGVQMARYRLKKKISPDSNKNLDDIL